MQSEWPEIATGDEARSMRRWARRVLPARIARATLILVAVTILVVAIARVYPPVRERPVYCIGPIVDCEESYRDSHIDDIWDAIF